MKTKKSKQPKVKTKRLMTTPGQPGGPCARCLALAWEGKIRTETIMPIPLGVGAAPLAEDGSGPCCHDCQAADTIGKTILGSRGRPIWAATEPGGQKHPLDKGMPFYALRIVVGNERQEQLRLPENLRKFFGLVAQGIVRPSVGPDALDEHHAWLAAVGINIDALGSDD